ncbi:hypothetical protein [Caballeronia sp. GAWG1-1]|uniref:DUF6998 domain-containing protein n=1 Tax=Caballeronia sp. GAWG1-1 TaxID=2921742 RepID=UPI002028B671|nr:hypothetical protein [Caballeronia sp. GAWG1-1]
MSHPQIKEGLKCIFEGIELLRVQFPHRRFTIDGRLVGDIGEIIAELLYDVKLDEVSEPCHDGVTSSGRRVQVKASFQDHLTFGKTPDYMLGLKLNYDGTFEEIYNGPGAIVRQRYEHRKHVGEKLLSFPMSELRKLSSDVAPQDRIAKR